MTTLTNEEVQAFCKHSDWCFQCWQLVKFLYSKNPDDKYFKHPEHIHFFNRLWKILQEYWLNEVAKLGDPAIQRSSSNLSIDYIYESGNWPNVLEAELDKLRSNLLTFSAKTKTARNKLLAHKDVATITSGITLGEFQEGEDDAYFESLQKYASIVHQHYVGSPYYFDNLTQNDVEVFTSTFVRGLLLGRDN